MSAKMKRRRRHDRLKRIRTERRENALFFANGTFPASAQSCAVCSCGARAFTRDRHDNLDDFDLTHSECGWSSEDYDGWQDVPDDATGLAA